jgi:hypothetical protein
VEHSFQNPPAPADPYDALRIQENRRRRRLLSGLWGIDLEQRLLLQFGLDRRGVIGPKSRIKNGYKRLCEELSCLFNDNPNTRHGAGELLPFLGPDGLLTRSGLWPGMRRVQTFTLGQRETFVRVDWAPSGKLTHRLVYADMFTAKSHDYDPGVPYEVSELRWREVDGKGKWTWETLSIEDLDRPRYEIREATFDGKEGPDLTQKVIGAPVSGDWYPYRWTQGERRGMPFIPGEMFHAEMPHALWDPFNWCELVDASLDLAVACNFWLHVMFRASWPQRYGVDVRVEGVATEDTDAGRRSGVPTDPTSFVHLTAKSGTQNPVVGQWLPGANVKEMGEAIGAFARMVSDVAGVDASHIVRESADAWSGAALSINRDGKREAQSIYAPQFHPPTLGLVEKSAAIVNLAVVLDAALPEEGYRLDFVGLPLSPQELEARRRHHTELIEAGRMSIVEAYAEEHPGATKDEARKALVDGRLEGQRIEQAAKEAAEKEKLVAPDANQQKELSGVLGQLAQDYQAKFKAGQLSREMARAGLIYVVGLSETAADAMVPANTEVTPPAPAPGAKPAPSEKDDDSTDDADEKPAPPPAK